MKRSIIIITVLAVSLAFFPAYGAETLVAGKSILLVNAGAINTQAMEEIRQFAEKSLLVPVRTIHRADNAQKTPLSLTALAQSCASLLTNNDVCLVVICKQPETVTETILVAPDQNWAAVNVTPLKTKDNALFNKRAERQVMRAITALFGVGYSLDPHAVNKHIISVEQLDEMGRNYDPPSLDQFHKQAILRGMEILTFRRKKWLIKHGYITDPAATNTTNTTKDK